ncbi:MAG TPA: LytR C-terminal domain-containing protein, partial [Acidimicrobiales bacterium]|nr:LytR C-terminal domain-containing protein [Acidimicrobiales bacterium]
LSRIRRDHEFLRVLASAVAQRGLGNPITDIQLTDAVAGDLTTDTGLNASAIASLVLTFHSLDPYQVPTYTLPIVEDDSPTESYYYRGSNYNAVVFPVQPLDEDIVSQFLGVTPSSDPTGNALPARSGITVAVENGSGEYDQGAQTAAELTALGYDVTSVGDTEVSASTTEATVLYTNPEQIDDALRLQEDLTGLATIGYDPGLFQGDGSIDVGSTPTGPQPDLVLVTGSNFQVNSPAPPPTSSPVPTTTTSPSSTTPASTTTTVPSYLSSNSDLAAPSASNPQLEPWDPRSCTASGGPGP